MYQSTFFSTIDLVCVISSNVLNTPSVPIPECLYPPNGISKLLKKLAPLMTAPPHSRALAILAALFISFVNTHPQSPKTERFES